MPCAVRARLSALRSGLPARVRETGPEAWTQNQDRLCSAKTMPLTVPLQFQQEQMCNEPPHGFLSQSSARMSLPSALRLGRDHDAQDHTSKLQCLGKTCHTSAKVGRVGPRTGTKSKPNSLQISDAIPDCCPRMPTFSNILIHLALDNTAALCIETP